MQVGDIVQVLDDEEIPCDLVVMSCSDAEGTCYITTANLDGETNLKVLCINIISADFYFPCLQIFSLNYSYLQLQLQCLCVLVLTNWSGELNLLCVFGDFFLFQNLPQFQMFRNSLLMISFRLVGRGEFRSYLGLRGWLFVWVF